MLMYPLCGWFAGAQAATQRCVAQLPVARAGQLQQRRLRDSPRHGRAVTLEEIFMPPSSRSTVRMRTSRAPSRCRVLFIIAFAAACGSDSTGPSQSPGSVAQHFDSLFVAAANLSDSIAALRQSSGAAHADRGARGVRCVAVQMNVTTASGHEHWKAFEFVELSRRRTPDLRCSRIGMSTRIR